MWNLNGSFMASLWNALCWTFLGMFYTTPLIWILMIFPPEWLEKNDDCGWRLFLLWLTFTHIFDWKSVIGIEISKSLKIMMRFY